jgi:predicted RNA-binding protein YlxR (DUF448 family)
LRNPPNEELTSQLRTPAQAGGQEEEESGPRPSPGHSLPTHIPERTCILSRRSAARGELIRLALSPDGIVAPDVRARAPGRGAWIGVDRATLAAAQAKGKLKAALARAFKTGAVSVPDDLPERIEAALRQAALDRLGLEFRAGNLVIGGEKIETALRRGQIQLLLHAADAGADGTSKLDQALRVGSEGEQRQGLVFPGDRATLSLALGRQNVVHAAILDRAAAARVRDLIARWAAFIGRNDASGAASAGSGASPAGSPATALSARADGIEDEGRE